MDSPCNAAYAITPSDTVNIAQFTAFGGRLTDAVYVGGAGIVVAVFNDNSTANFTAVAGELLPIAVKRINNTTTTATLMVAMYRI